VVELACPRWDSNPHNLFALKEAALPIYPRGHRGRRGPARFNPSPMKEPTTFDYLLLLTDFSRSSSVK
jgi:hypothetical protein